MIINSVIASLPALGGYFSLIKLGVLLLGVVAWLAICQWVDKDSWRLRYKRHLWNTVILIAGVVGLVLWLVVPLFWIGLAFNLVVLGGAVGAYVHLRNQLVPETSRILSATHLGRLFKRTMPEPKAEIPQVSLTTSSHQTISPLNPADAMYEGYQVGQQLLAEALTRRAEGVAITPNGDKANLQFTIDGVASKATSVERRLADLVVAYFKRIGGLDVDDHRRPQAARIIADEPAQPIDKVTLDAGYNVPPVLPARTCAIDIRTSGTRAGESLNIRITDQTQPLTIERLGLDERQLRALADFRAQPGGVVIFGSAEGVGSTTSFYQAMRAHDTFLSNIQTLEERPEEELENITQHVYKQEATEDLSFARQLQSIIRRGPDIIGVSQCKDKETAQLIARAAGDKIKFYVEMAGKDTFTLLARWAALVVDMSLAMSPVRLVFAQTFVRKLCPGCREAYRPDPQLLRKINLPADRIERLYRPLSQIPTDREGQSVVCPLCQGTGYLGRTGVFEMLIVDDELRKLIVNNASANEIKTYCRTHKMLYLQEEGLRKIMAGETSINEVVRVFAENK